jgi:hypothetical protein
METVLGQQRTRGVRDGMSSGREPGWSNAFSEAGEIPLVELPDSAWQGTKCRDPSTQLCVPFGFAQGRSAFGRDDRV